MNHEGVALGWNCGLLSSLWQGEVVLSILFSHGLGSLAGMPQDTKPAIPLAFILIYLQPSVVAPRWPHSPDEVAA